MKRVLSYLLAVILCFSTTVALANEAKSTQEPEATQESNIDLEYLLECVSKIPEYAISGVAPPFLRHKARLSAAKPSDLFLELTKNPLELADFPF